MFMERISSGWNYLAMTPPFAWWIRV